MAKARLKIDQGAVESLATSSEMERFLLRVAQAGADGAARRAPRQTGTLSESYEAESAPGEARFGSNLEYANEVELGTYEMAAQPHLRPAIDDARAEAERG